MALLWIYVYFLRISDKYWLMWINRVSGFPKKSNNIFCMLSKYLFALLMRVCDKMVSLCQKPCGSAGIQKDCAFYTWIGEKFIQCYVVFVPKHLLLGETPYSYLKLKKYWKGFGQQEDNFSVPRALGGRVTQRAYRTLLLQKLQKLWKIVLVEL